MKKKIISSLFVAIILTGGVVFADVINMPGAPVMPEKPKPEYNGIYKHIDSPQSNFAPSPSAGNYNQPLSNLNNSSGSNTSAKAQLDAISMSILRDAESHKSGGQVDQNKIKKMMDLGATGLCSPQIIAKPPGCTNPNPHSITVNGKTLKGRLCAKTCYEYKGKQYDVGYCK